MLPRETETHPTLHADEAEDMVKILMREANRTAQELGDAWGADDLDAVEKLGHWIIRIQLLLTAFGRSDIARRYSAHSVFNQPKLIKAPSQEKP